MTVYTILLKNIPPLDLQFVTQTDTQAVEVTKPLT